jgi:hypothetical protein
VGKNDSVSGGIRKPSVHISGKFSSAVVAFWDEEKEPYKPNILWD